MDVTLAASVDEFFHEVVTDALTAVDLDASEPASWYLVGLLGDFTRTRLTDEPLGLKLAEVGAAAPAERVRTLKQVGDTSLYVAGFFAESLTRSLVDVDYYVGLGQKRVRPARPRMRSRHLAHRGLRGAGREVPAVRGRARRGPQAHRLRRANDVDAGSTRSGCAPATSGSRRSCARSACWSTATRSSSDRRSRAGPADAGARPARPRGAVSGRDRRRGRRLRDRRVDRAMVWSATAGRASSCWSSRTTARCRSRCSSIRPRSPTSRATTRGACSATTTSATSCSRSRASATSSMPCAARAPSARSASSSSSSRPRSTST